MTLEILKIIQFMLNHGFYMNLRELKEISLPMINLLNGSNDIYAKTDDESITESLEEFLGVKRYFSSGSNDVIVKSKAIICENLLIVSQLEIDGKVLVFLSKFKHDLDMLFLQKQISCANPEHAHPEKEEHEEHQQKGFFKNFKIPTIGKKADNNPEFLTF